MDLPKDRTVVANIALSLDERMSGRGGEFEWDGSSRMQLKNYQGFASYWPRIAEDESADPSDRAFSKWLNSAEKIGFSSMLKEATWENSHIVNADPAKVTEELRQQPGGDIVVLASGSVIRRLLREDVLDRLSITLCPEVVGGGGQLFDDGLPASSWDLNHSAPTESGALRLLYDRIR